MHTTEKIPVTILTGFLGAGKTTLLNEMLRQNPSTRFAIIENEFGVVALDRQFVAAGSLPLVEISSGCLCCTVNDELYKALEGLYEQRADFDHVVIETTGIADPAGVIAPFLTVPAVAKAFELRQVICLADGRYLEASLAERLEVRQQIAFADLVLLNKQDLVAAAERQSLKGLLTSINPHANVLTCTQGQVDTRALLGRSAHQHRDAAHTQAAHQHAHAQSGITTQAFTFDRPFDSTAFKHWMQVLLTVQGAAIYRIKGILYFAGHAQRIAFQSVRKQAAYTEDEPWPADQPRQSQLVFIGQALNRKAIEKKLSQCLVKAAAHSSINTSL